MDGVWGLALMVEATSGAHGLTGLHCVQVHRLFRRSDGTVIRLFGQAQVAAFPCG